MLSQVVANAAEGFKLSFGRNGLTGRIVNAPV
jgi:hypothetical protein